MVRIHGLREERSAQRRLDLFRAQPSLYHRSTGATDADDRHRVDAWQSKGEFKCDLFVSLPPSCLFVTFFFFFFCSLGCFVCPFFSTATVNVTIRPPETLLESGGGGPSRGLAAPPVGGRCRWWRSLCCSLAWHAFLFAVPISAMAASTPRRHRRQLGYQQRRPTRKSLVHQRHAAGESGRPGRRRAGSRPASISAWPSPRAEWFGRRATMMLDNWATAPPPTSGAGQGGRTQ